MNKYNLKAGSTSKSVVLRAIDNITGLPVTTLLYNTAGLSLYYERMGAANVAIAPAELTALTEAWSSGGFLHIGNGYYRLDVPDAALIAGSASVLIHGSATDITIMGVEITLETKVITDLNDLSSENVTESVPTVNEILAGLNAGSYDGKTFTELMTALRGLGFGNIAVTDNDDTYTVVLYAADGTTPIATFTTNKTTGARTIN